MRIKTIAKVLENPYIEKVIIPHRKTKDYLQWDGYIKAKLKEMRYE